MTKLYWEKDVKTEHLKQKTIAVLGYGSQGKAHALNLRDSGYSVLLGLRPDGQSWQNALDDDWLPMTPDQAVRQADVIAFLVPDMNQPQLYALSVSQNLKKGASLLFAHGFCVHFGLLSSEQSANIVLVAPKGPGHLVREQFTKGKGVPCLVAVHTDHTGTALDTALAYAHGLGGTRAGVLETSFAEETETDLFGEQAVLCGGVTELIKMGFETLVHAGYQPELAYFECMHELKLIVDLLYEGGFEKLHQYVSETAIYGDLTRGPRVIDQHVRENMNQILEEIRDRRFANEWVGEHRSGYREYHNLLKEDLEHPIEKVGRRLRAQMSWLTESKTHEAPA